MTYDIDTNSSSASTTWVPKVTKMRKFPPGGQQDVAKRPSFRNLRRRSPREPLTITVRYRAGSEAWWYIEARGVGQAFPGHLCLHDVLSAINGQGPVHQRVGGGA